MSSLSSEIVSVKDKVVECRDTLKQILIDKKIEGLEEETKLTTLINKVELLEDFIPPLVICDKGKLLNGFSTKVEYLQATAYNNKVEWKEDHLYFGARMLDGTMKITFLPVVDVSLYNKCHITYRIASKMNNASFTHETSKETVTCLFTYSVTSRE